MTSPWTRREMLAAFLGLPAAMRGCRWAETGPSLPPGELVGASVDVGHRLRDGATVTVPDDRWEHRRVVIVGGGIAGLSAARRLRMAGIDDFVILELEPKPGGTSRSGQSNVSAFPWGAHYIPVPMKENRALIALLDEMGLVEGTDTDGEPLIAEQHLCWDPQERVFFKGRWYEGLYLHAGASDDDLRQLAAFRGEIDRWAAWRDGQRRRAFAIPMATGSDDAHVTALDRLSMADWMDQHGFTSPRLRWLVDYSCRDDYGCRSEQASAWAGLFYFAARLRRPGLPAQPFITWPEGNGRLVEHLYRPVRKQTELGWAVADINPVDRNGRREVDLAAVSYDGRSARGFHAEHVLFAAPQFLTPYLIRPYRERRPSHIGEFAYGPWAVANLTLRDRPVSRGFPMAWDNVLYESPSLGYVAATHQLGIDYGPTVLTYYYPLCDESPPQARRKLLSADRDDWAEIVLSDIEPAHHDIRRLTERLDVMRWGHAMIRPRPGFVWGGARSAAAKPYRGIHFANTDLSGVALFEEAFYHGIRSAEELLTSLGQPAKSIL